MDELLKTPELCIEVLCELCNGLKERQEEVAYQIDKQTTLFDILLKVCPMLESMVQDDLIDCIKALGNKAYPPIKLYGDEDNLNVKHLFKICSKFNSKALTEQICLFDQLYIPSDPNAFMKKNKIKI